MRAEVYLKNKVKRQIEWNGREATFIHYKQNQYHETTDEVEWKKTIKGVFHEGGGYGGMLNFELYERDGSRMASRMKPMFLCALDDATEITMGDIMLLNNHKYKVIEKSNVSELNVAYEISFELIQDSQEDTPRLGV